MSLGRHLLAPGALLSMGNGKMFEKIVVVTKKTALEELIERFNSKPQAKFYIEHSGASFEEYEDAHEIYNYALNDLRKILPRDIKQQFIERAFLPNFLFGEKDLVVTVGPDGLVINTAKYLNNQPILAVNPDVLRVDGILIPFDIASLKPKINRILQGIYSVKNISMAQVNLNTGQELYGVNDIFVGPKKQISFRYNIEHCRKQENQCSSGIVISTGAGSTGWFKSIITGSRIIATAFDGTEINTTKKQQFEWDADYLYYCVREPFPSMTSGINLVLGRITKNEPLYLTSKTPSGAIIFSDGIEQDFLEFNSGTSACITLAGKKARLIRK
jgi:NAD kinase